jgi:hypothetical protein
MVKIREDQSQGLDWQANAIAACFLAAIGLVACIHLADHYRHNKKIVKRQDNA